MKKTLTINDVVLIFPEVEKLYKQDNKFKIGTAYKIVQLYNELRQLNMYMIDRIGTILPKLLYGEPNLTQEELEIYGTIMSSTVEIDNKDLSLDEICADGNADISPSGMEKLLRIL